MKKISFRDKLSYRVDNVMSKGTMALVSFLGLITLIICIIAGIAALVVQKGWADGSFPESIWKSFLFALDSGNLSGVEGSITFVIIAAVATLCGLFITSTLIGIINSGLEAKLDNLRRGRSKVIESGHTVILGFNEAVYTILSELIIANENQKKSCIVVLGQEDKQVMEESIASRIQDTKKTRIICRSGDTSDYSDLAKCSLENCKSIIINEDEDFLVIKSILAVTNLLEKEEAQDCNVHITATIRDAGNIDAARIAGQGRTEILFFSSAISRIMAHVCYQPGLSAVYTDLFNFDGDEIYIEKFPQLTGKKFFDVLPMFEESTVIGIKQGSNVALNPSMETIIKDGDEIILIAADDGISFPKEVKHKPVKEVCIDANLIKHEPKMHNLLVLGYNELFIDVLNELELYMAKGSVVKIASNYEGLEDDINNLFKSNNKIQTKIERCDICSRAVLERLIGEDVEHILVLSDVKCNERLADEKTLLILLHLRDIGRKNNKNFSITSEFLDMKNQELAKNTNVSDFVISSNIASLIISQISENRFLAPIFEDLLDTDGSEIYMKPASLYIKTGIKTDIYTVAYSAASRGEILIGYKKVHNSNSQNEEIEIVTNPQKSKEVVFTEDDWLIVIAEEY